MEKYPINQERAMRNTVNNIQKKLNFNDEDISKILGYKDVEKYKRKDTWSENTIERSVTLTGIITGLMGLYDSDFENVKKWLTTERDFTHLDKDMGKQTPLDLMTRGQYHMRLVEESVLEIRGLR